MKVVRVVCSVYSMVRETPPPVRRNSLTDTETLHQVHHNSLTDSGTPHQAHHSSLTDMELSGDDPVMTMAGIATESRRLTAFAVPSIYLGTIVQIGQPNVAASKTELRRSSRV
jgi:hypothetical protein